MKMCDRHWTALRAEVARVGLESFIAQDSKAAMIQTVASLEASRNGALSDEKRNFEPLLGAYWAIVNNAMRYVGLALYAQNEDGTDRCPLCFVTADHLARCTVVDCQFKDFDSWIVHSVEDQLEYAKSIGLVGAT